MGDIVRGTVGGQMAFWNPIGGDDGLGAWEAWEGVLQTLPRLFTGLATDSNGRTHYVGPIGTVATEAGQYLSTRDLYLQEQMQEGSLIYASGVASASGANLIVTGAVGSLEMRMRLSYVSYNPDSPVTAYFSFGPSGTPFLLNKLQGNGSIVAKDFGDFRSVVGEWTTDLIGGGDTSKLYLNLSAAVPTQWNVFYTQHLKVTRVNTGGG